jgi:MFS family permease
MTATADAGAQPRGNQTGLVVAASAAGTAFEWYDFFIFGALTAIITRNFFTGVDETVGFVLALATFGVGFGVRPLGALFFGRIGDRLGRKGAFLLTITLMGAATIAIGLLPTYGQIGLAAPVLLV